MNYLHFIPHVNRIDLTSIALNSVKNLWDRTIIIDNSNNSKEILSLFDYHNFQFNILKPPVPLTTAQTYNLMRLIAIEQSVDFITFMHNDCEILTQNGDLMLIEESNEQFSNPFNRVGFINYNNTDSEQKHMNDDLFCSYNTNMLQDVGEWDWLCCPFYFLDNDYMRRMSVNGWKSYSMENLYCKHHNASSTIKADKLRKLINPIYFDVSKELMKIKWLEYNGNWDNLKDD
jgi:hypothetical protein